MALLERIKVTVSMGLCLQALLRVKAFLETHFFDSKEGLFPLGNVLQSRKT